MGRDRHPPAPAEDRRHRQGRPRTGPARSRRLSKLNVGQRLKLLEEKIISFTRDLMHFDHFAIRLLDRRTNKLEMVISAGLPPRR